MPTMFWVSRRAIGSARPGPFPLLDLAPKPSDAIWPSFDRGGKKTGANVAPELNATFRNLGANPCPTGNQFAVRARRVELVGQGRPAQCLGSHLASLRAHRSALYAPRLVSGDRVLHLIGVEWQPAFTPFIYVKSK
jgi:hypothetical protein